MSTGYRDSNKKFHPINNKTRKVRYSGKQRQVGVGIKLGKPKSPAEKIKMDKKIKQDITTDLAFRNELFTKNELLFEKIEAGSGEGYLPSAKNVHSAIPSLTFLNPIVSGSPFGLFRFANKSIVFCV